MDPLKAKPFLRRCSSGIFCGATRTPTRSISRTSGKGGRVAGRERAKRFFVFNKKTCALLKGLLRIVFFSWLLKLIQDE